MKFFKFSAYFAQRFSLATTRHNDTLHNILTYGILQMQRQHNNGDIFERVGLIYSLNTKVKFVFNT